MRRVTRDAPIRLHRRMLVNKRPLLVRMTLDAGRIGARRQPGLLQFETAVRIVTIAALHRAFQHLVMKRQIELVLRLTMTAQTKLRLTGFQQLQIGEARLLRVCLRDEDVGGRQLPAACLRVGRVTVSATDVVAPVLAAPEVVVFLFPRMTPQTCFRDLFRRFVLERDDLLRIPFLAVRLPWTMTRLAASHLLFPTGQLCQLRMRGVGKILELIFVAVFTSIAAHIIFRLIFRDCDLALLCRLRRCAGSQPNSRRDHEGTDQECFDGLVQSSLL